MNKKHQGSMSELKAAAWLLSQGYEVFKNVSQHGDIDLITIKDGKIEKFDVKTRPKPPDHKSYYHPRLRQSQANQNIKIIVVDVDGCCEILHEPLILGTVPSKSPRRISIS